MSSKQDNGRLSNFSTNSNISSSLKTFYKIKLILVGNSGVGKTSLLSRYIEEEFIPNKSCTICADYKIKSIKIDTLTYAQITIWDTCGQEKYKSLTKQYFKDVNGIILMFDVCNKRSFEDLDEWLNEIKKNSVNQDASIILVGNKIDLNNRNISLEDGSKFAKDNNLIYDETSSKEGINIVTVFNKVTKDIINKINMKNQFDDEVKENISLGIKESSRGKKGQGERGKKKCC